MPDILGHMALWWGGESGVAKEKTLVWEGDGGRTVSLDLIDEFLEWHWYSEILLRF